MALQQYQVDPTLWAQYVRDLADLQRIHAFVPGAAQQPVAYTQAEQALDAATLNNTASLNAINRRHQAGVGHGSQGHWWRQHWWHVGAGFAGLFLVLWIFGAGPFTRPFVLQNGLTAAEIQKMIDAAKPSTAPGRATQRQLPPNAKVAAAAKSALKPTPNSRVERHEVVENDDTHTCLNGKQGTPIDIVVSRVDGTPYRHRTWECPP